MRRTLGTPMLVLVLTAALGAGCGSQDETADDSVPSSSPSSTTSPPAPEPDPEAESPTPSTEGEVIDLLSETGAGGETDEALTYADNDASWGRFLSQFSSVDLVDEIRRTVAGADSGPGTRVGAATVMIGCDVPPGVFIDTRALSTDYTVTPQKVPDPLQECFAPVTTVAVVEVPTEG